MKIAGWIALFALVGGLSACSTSEVVTRSAPYEQLPDTALSTPSGYEPVRPSMEAPAAWRKIGSEPGTKAFASLPGVEGTRDSLDSYGSPVTVNSVVVRVPRSLTVSERNVYLPRADIVWRGDPIGDRHAQVQKIFETALSRGVADLKGPIRVDLDVQVRRFHALTEKARYTIGGVHAITFDLAIKDPETGELLVPVRRIRADLEAFGGQQAILADARGETQKVRITNHLAEVIREELSNPEGYRNASLGFIQLLNNI